MEDKEFKFTYSAPNEQERKEVLKIQNEYLPKEADPKDEKISRLKKLDRLVKMPCQIASSIIGIIGFCCFGGGMAMSMESPYVLWGAILGVAGIILMAFSYPIYNKIFSSRKNKYASQILEISQSILQDSNRDNVSLNIKQTDGDIADVDEDN